MQCPSKGGQCRRLAMIKDMTGKSDESWRWKLFEGKAHRREVSCVTVVKQNDSIKDGNTTIA
jgi:hypothetical protein